MCINSTDIYFISVFDGVILNKFNLDMNRYYLEMKMM
ncbi:hypothetical protein ACTQ4K_18025 [Clostridium sporogenes]